MKLLTKFNLILLAVLLTAGAIIAGISYHFLIGEAKREVFSEAELMLDSAKSVRDYTADDLSPLLQQNPRHKVRFLAETVPFFAATTTFNRLRANYPDYTYKEATLNPTNLEDRAGDWESDVIRELRDHPERKQTTGERDTAGGRSMYVARPIPVETPCLECHSTPAAAPHAMITVYGANNGFGWKLHEIVGTQIITVPESVPVAIANQAWYTLLAILAGSGIVILVALDAGVYWFVIRPLREVSTMADRVSTGEHDVEPLAVHGRDEIASVTASFNRMQLSLAKALKLLDES